MTDRKRVGVCLVVDRSGSIRNILEDAQGAVDNFLDGRRKQAADGTTVYVRLAQFDTEYDVVFPTTRAQDMPAYTIAPRGMTAMLDAMGRGITEFGEELAAMPEAERPGTVVFAIMTDGKENSSREWTRGRVAALVKQQEEQYNWSVVYLGANQDAVLEARRVGVRAGSSLTYGTTSEEMESASQALDCYVVAAASAEPGERVEFTEAQRRSSKRS